ncbi:hypothetical protein M422DRAFT_256172 [Sphaerobolus stellatus SS14]|uniref:Uncharacterized protein n=1 Tax=Sphaerobolus stellatus (strain SS14) TaxID=990650 RepID=A0A0C9VR17_SPHS4|nr:hypothetical protein M422DRAFT_256172 [Sphaerobolus stellatus SS14]
MVLSNQHNSSPPRSYLYLNSGSCDGCPTILKLLLKIYPPPHLFNDQQDIVWPITDMAWTTNVYDKVPISNKVTGSDPSPDFSKVGPYWNVGYDHAENVLADLKHQERNLAFQYTHGYEHDREHRDGLMGAALQQLEELLWAEIHLLRGPQLPFVTRLPTDLRNFLEERNAPNEIYEALECGYHRY